MQGWHSLGLYAVPGALVEVTADPHDALAELVVQIGCHDGN